MSIVNAVTHGYKLDGIKRALKFHQSTWLKEFILILMELKRKEGMLVYEVQLLKDCSNIIFRRLCLNYLKQCRMRLITDAHKKPLKVLSNPRVKNIHVFTENFAAIELNKSSVQFLYLQF
jgi:hypothetical protein